MDMILFDVHRRSFACDGHRKGLALLHGAGLKISDRDQAESMNRTCPAILPCLHIMISTHKMTKSLHYLSSELLSSRSRVRTIARTREVGRTVLVPGVSLRSDVSLGPAISVGPHAVVDDPVLVTIWALNKASVADTICILTLVLVEDAAVIALPPVFRVHRVVANQF